MHGVIPGKCRKTGAKTWIKVQERGDPGDPQRARRLERGSGGSGRGTRSPASPRRMTRLALPTPTPSPPPTPHGAEPLHHAQRHGPCSPCRHGG